MEVQGDQDDQKAERVGIVLVHGIGEQTRFEHLDGEVRKLTEALKSISKFTTAEGGRVIVEILRGWESPFHAEQDSRRTGPWPTVRVMAKAKNGREKHFLFHEVWWADINERYSLAKQVRFWLWGLSIWLYPGKERSGYTGAEYVYPPDHAGGLWANFWVRVRLICVGVVFVMLGFSIGIILFILKRLFEIETPKWLQTITNYVSGVKLYNQKQRRAPSWILDDEDFLDTVGEPPRYSIRRRMIRALADAASNRYDRWYVLAHSLGSVVAFNGLMETAYTWPGYLDEDTWHGLKFQELVGPMAEGAGPIPDHTVPRRPTWCGDEIAYRRRIFQNFRGFMTYGSPLEKFATIWPARVPIAREPAFPMGAVWVNILDPIDPVSGMLKSFAHLTHACCPTPINVGYRAGWVLLMAHIQYLSRRGKSNSDLPIATVRWLLGEKDAPGTGDNLLSGFQYDPVSAERLFRGAVAWLWWIAGFASFAIFAGIAVPIFLKLSWTGVSGMACEVNNNTALSLARWVCDNMKVPK